MLNHQIRHILDAYSANTSYKLAPPEVAAHGHLSTNIAFALAKNFKESSITSAHKVKSFLLENAPRDFFERIDIVPPGFINIWFTKEAIQNEFAKISKAKGWGKPDAALVKARKAQNVIVEYSSPNIAKPMHVGHFRSTIIGDALADIHKFLGYKTIRWNYLGDWGTQFGKLLAAYKMWGDEKLLKKEPIKHLLDLYVRFSNEIKVNPDFEKRGQEEFKKLENGDRDNKKLWKEFRDESLKEFEEMYKTFGVKFDVVRGESAYESELKYIIGYLLEEEVAVVSEGAVIIPLDDFGLPPVMVQKGDGATLYFTRDIANLIYRLKKYKPAKIIYEIGSEQELHFKQLFAVAKADFMPELKEAKNTELVHVGHGLVLGEDGKKLSTRAGKTIFMDDVIAEALEKTRKIIDEKNPDLPVKEKDKIAKAVALGALKYNDLSQNRLSNITFDWDKMLSFEGDSGPYLQYSYARLKSILRKARIIHNSKLIIQHLSSDLELEIILKLDRFPEVVESVAKTYFPNELTTYLYDLAKSINHFYQSAPVLKAEKGVREARLALISKSAEVLKTGLNLLGIDTLERM